MSGVPYVFGNATTSIPLSQLDVNFATNATLGNATVGLGNTTTTVGNLTVQNVTLSSTNGDANIHGLTVGLGGGSVSTNTAVGASALSANTSGAQNTAVGASALTSNTIASNNTALGYQAGYTNVNGNGNTFVGYQAGYTSNYPTNGQIANTFVGYQSGYSVTTGYKNTILGSFSGNQGGLDIRTLYNYIVLSDGDGNPNLILDNNGRLSIGTASSYGKARIQTANNEFAGLFEATNASYTYEVLSVRPSRNTTNGSFYALAYYNNGAAAYKFYVIDSGAIYSTSTSITSISDQRFKENIKDIDVGLDAVMALKPRRFDWIDGKGEDRKNAVGFIAQEVQQTLPDLITQFTINKDDTEEYLGLRSQDLIPTLVKAIQEQQALITAQAADIAALKAKVGI